MVKVERFTGDKTYMFPSGAIATPEIIRDRYPAVDSFTHIVETDESGEVMWAIENLAATRSLNGVDPALTDDEAIVEIERVRNEKPEVPPSAEERIAAALEFQNLLSL